MPEMVVAERVVKAPKAPVTFPDGSTLNFVTPPTCKSSNLDDAPLAVFVTLTLNADGLPVVCQVWSISKAEPDSEPEPARTVSDITPPANGRYDANADARLLKFASTSVFVRGEPFPALVTIVTI